MAEQQAATPHDGAWCVPAEQHEHARFDPATEYGVLVRCGPRTYPYWWVLCPASATLVADPKAADDFDGCSLGIECDWDDVHRAAGELWADLDSITPTTAPSGDVA